MSKLTLTLSEAVSRVSDFLGDTNNTVPTGTALTLATDIVARALRRFLYPIDARTGTAHEWSFLKQLYRLPLKALTWQYPLPANFSELVSDPVFGDDDLYPAMKKIAPEKLLNLRAAQTTEFAPSFYAIARAGAGSTLGEQDEIWFYPIPDSGYTVRFWYKLDPLKPEAIGEVLPGGVKAAEAIIEHCLAVAEQQENDKVGLHTELAARLTQELIVHDTRSNDSMLIGSLRYGDSYARPLVDHSTYETQYNNWYVGE
jgi:hypothetical protein